MRATDRDVELAASAHQRLLAELDRLVADAGLDVAAPSRLPDWTRGHVLAHIRQSGDGHARLLAAADRGEIGVQYPDGIAGRAAHIEAEAGLAAAEQVALLRRSIWDLEAAWARSRWSGEGEGPRGPVKMTELPFMRLREVAVHHVDLDIGYGFDDLPGEYVRSELRRMEMSWKARQPMGLTQLPTAALRAAPPRRLAWLLGRAEIEGLDPAAVF